MVEAGIELLSMNRSGRYVADISVSRRGKVGGKTPRSLVLVDSGALGDDMLKTPVCTPRARGHLTTRKALMH